jgi:hypothetical protein
MHGASSDAQKLPKWQDSGSFRVWGAVEGYESLVKIDTVCQSGQERLSVLT